METEGLSFETSEVLATFLASTPLLAESWRLCSLANTTPDVSFMTAQIGSIGYLAFSSMKLISESDICYGSLVRLDSANYQLFSPLHRQINENEDPILVHTCFLQLFCSIYASPDFKTQIYDSVEEASASSVDSMEQAHVSFVDFSQPSSLCHRGEAPSTVTQWRGCWHPVW